MDMGVHCIDLIQYITNSKARRVAALNGTTTFNYDLEDSSMLLFELDNGAFCCVASHFNIPDSASKWILEFYGTKGRLIGNETIGQVDGGSIDAVLVEGSTKYDAQQNKKATGAADIKVEFENMYTREIESFGFSILEGMPVEVPGEEAIQVQKVVEAAYESSRSGRFVEI